MPPAPTDKAPPPRVAREFDRLRRPVWIYDPESRRGLYANTAAVELWDAPDRAALLGARLLRPVAGGPHPGRAAEPGDRRRRAGHRALVVLSGRQAGHGAGGDLGLAAAERAPGAAVRGREHRRRAAGAARGRGAAPHAHPDHPVRRRRRADLRQSRRLRSLWRGQGELRRPLHRRRARRADAAPGAGRRGDRRALRLAHPRRRALVLPRRAAGHRSGQRFGQRAALRARRHRPGRGRARALRRPRTGRGGRGQAAVPGQHQPRAAHAAEQRAGVRWPARPHQAGRRPVRPPGPDRRGRRGADPDRQRRHRPLRTRRRPGEPATRAV